MLCKVIISMIGIIIIISMIEIITIISMIEIVIIISMIEIVIIISMSEMIIWQQFDFLSCISDWNLTQHWLEMTMATIR